MSRLNGIYPEKKYYKTQVRQTIIHQYTLLTIMMWGKNENNMQHLHEGTVGNEIQLARKKTALNNQSPLYNSDNGALWKKNVKW